MANFYFNCVLFLALFFGFIIRADAMAKEICSATCSGEGQQRACSYTFTLDFYASTTGYFKVAECGDNPQPVLTMEAGVEYTFIQEDLTNWNHPLGFAYFPDGAHNAVDELEPSLTPDTPGSSCAETLTCQHPLYFTGTQFLGNDGNKKDFGVQEYTSWFERSQVDWTKKQDDDGPFNVKLTIKDSNTEELFYFCHVHDKMSGHILVLDGHGGPPSFRSGSGTPAIDLGYQLEVPTKWDSKCGTFGAFRFSDAGNHDKYCPDTSLLCPGHEKSLFANCLKAIDCKMMSEMTVKFEEEDPAITFMHQMIPHHINAINMAKILLKHTSATADGMNNGGMGTDHGGMDNDGMGTDHGGMDNDGMGSMDHGGDMGDIQAMLRDIINGQNKQIMTMNHYLMANGKATYPAYEDEYTTCPS